MNTIKTITLAVVCAGCLLAAGCQTHSTSGTTQQSGTVQGANQPQTIIGCGSCDR